MYTVGNASIYLVLTVYRKEEKKKKRPGMAQDSARLYFGAESNFKDWSRMKPSCLFVHPL